MLGNLMKRCYQATCKIRHYASSSDCRRIDPECFITPEMAKYLTCRKDVKLDMCVIDEAMVDPCWDLPEVVIIGAGIAGLSAAARLATSGMHKIKVIEATHRAGGRIHTSKFGNVPVDIGATYIEGASIANPAYTLASQEELISRPPLRQNPYAGLCITSDANVVPNFISSAAQDSFIAMVSRAAELYVAKNDLQDYGSLSEFLGHQMDYDLTAFPFKYRDYASRVMLSDLIGLKNKLGTCLRNTPAKEFGSLIDLAGGRIRLPTGMIGILAPLLRALPDCESMMYCKPVSKILYSTKVEFEDEAKTRPKPRVTINCCDGTSFTADYVICTLPLGVLKKQADTMFEPALNPIKMNAIKRLGYGHINHIYFEYNHPFWIWQEGSIHPCWRMDELRDNGHWLKGISVIEEVPTSQQILAVTLSHDAAKCVEELTELKLAEDFTRLLRRFLNNPTIPYPVNVLRTNWSSCPYSLGGKSFIPLDGNVSDVCEVARSVPEHCDQDVPVILFAGEATAYGAYGTVHGARMSGIREAESLINFTKKFQGKPGCSSPCQICAGPKACSATA